jgi:AhpD family alkylhydroperoxidase
MIIDRTRRVDDTGTGAHLTSAGESNMSTLRLWTDAEVDADPRVKAVFDDIRRSRKSDFVNNFWRALANQPDTLERIWAGLKQVMVQPSALDPLVKEMIYIAVSTANGCSYCVHSHTAGAKARGMTEAQHADLLAVIGMAAQTNALANALQLPVDPQFLVT